MTLDYAKQLAEKANHDLKAAQDDHQAAKQAVVGAQEKLAAVSKPPPLTEAESDAIDAAKYDLALARNQVTGTEFAVRRAEQTVASTRARVERLAPHAKLLDQIEAAVKVVEQRDRNARRLLVRFEDELRDAVKHEQEAVEAAGALLAKLPGDCRLDVTYPIHVSLFAGIDWRDPGLLRLVGEAGWMTLVRSEFREEPSPQPWKKAGAR